MDQGVILPDLVFDKLKLYLLSKIRCTYDLYTIINEDLGWNQHFYLNKSNVIFYTYKASKHRRKLLLSYFHMDFMKYYIPVKYIPNKFGMMNPFRINIRIDSYTVICVRSSDRIGWLKCICTIKRFVVFEYQFQVFTNQTHIPIDYDFPTQSIKLVANKGITRLYEERYNFYNYYFVSQHFVNLN